MVSHFREILSNLEIGIRKFIPKLPLPAVFTDATAQVITIKKFLASVFSCEVSYVFQVFGYFFFHLCIFLSAFKIHYNFLIV